MYKIFLWNIEINLKRWKFKLIKVMNFILSNIKNKEVKFITKRKQFKTIK